MKTKGVPEGAVKSKMQHEGINPDVVFPKQAETVDNQRYEKYKIMLRVVKFSFYNAIKCSTLFENFAGCS